MIVPAVFFVVALPAALGSARDGAVQAGIFILGLAILASRFVPQTTNDNSIEKLLKFLVVPLAGSCLLLGRRAGQEELHLDMAGPPAAGEFLSPAAADPRPPLFTPQACILSAAAIL